MKTERASPKVSPILELLVLFEKMSSGNVSEGQTRRGEPDWNMAILHDHPAMHNCGMEDRTGAQAQDNVGEFAEYVRASKFIGLTRKEVEPYLRRDLVPKIFQGRKVLLWGDVDWTKGVVPVLQCLSGQDAVIREIGFHEMLNDVHVSPFWGVMGIKQELLMKFRAWFSQGLVKKGQ